MAQASQARAVVVPVGRLIALLAGWYLLHPGGYLNQRKAVAKVQGHIVSVTTGEGPRDYTVAELIRDYDSEKQTLLVGGLLKQARDLQEPDLPWQVSYIGGRFAVGCTYHGELYSLDTDLINVTPVSDAARRLLDLEHATFEHRNTYMTPRSGHTIPVIPLIDPRTGKPME